MEHKRQLLFLLHKKSKKSQLILGQVLALVVVLVGFAQAQGVKSTFTGTVRDAAGAVVADSKISVKNLETNVVVTTTTNEAGEYIVPFLNSGTYSLTAESEGFKRAIEPNVKLDVTAKVRVDFALQVGQVTQSVQVSGAAPLLETDTSTVGTVITSEKLTQLPLLGRNYQALAQLSPTAVAPTPSLMGSLVLGLSVGNYYQVAGQRGAAIAYSVDGIGANNPLYQWQSIIPSADTIQEFKVQSHDFSAEFGRGTVQFTTTTKAGTDKLHGSLYEYNQNNHYNATNYFDKRAGIKNPVFNQNQFGATVGGPIWLPGIYNGHDKTFFFFGYEGTRRFQESILTGRFPDPTWLTGDFSSLGQTIYDPLTTAPNGSGGFTRDPFPGNIIPSDRFDPNAVAALQYLLKPNSIPGTLPGNANTAESVSTADHVNYWTARIDHNISNSDHLYGRYMQSLEALDTPGLGPLTERNTSNRSRNAMIAESHTFSPTIFNELRVGYNRGNFRTLQAGANGDTNYVNDIFHFQNIGGGPITWGLPTMTFANYSQIGGNIDVPIASLINGFQVMDNLAISRGHHVLKMGTDIRPERFYTIFGTGNRGSFNFSGQFTQLPDNSATGSPFADFLLGYSNQAIGLAGEASGHFHTTTYGFYFQDDWRATDRLTLNLGLRYEYYSPWTEANGKNSRFIFGSPIGSCFENTNPCPPGTIFQPKPGDPIYTTDKNNFAPRIGLAYSLGPSRRTVIRAAYGIFYTPLEVTEDVNNLMNPPNTYRFTLTPDNPFTDLTTTQLDTLFPASGFVPGTVLQTGPSWTLPRLQVFSPVEPWHTATVDQWQLSVQRELMHNLILEVGYMGSHGYHFQRVVNGNQAVLDQPGQLTSVLSRTPYPQLGPFMRAIEHNATNSYNAGTLRAERRFEKGLSLLVAYTYAKTMDDYGNTNDFTGFIPQYTYDLSAEKGLSGFDARHRLTVGYVWQLPVGRGRLLGSNLNPVLDGFIGGWQINGITAFQSGHPLKIAVPTDQTNTGTLAAGVRPNQIAPVTYLDPDSHNLQWFNPNAFQLPALGTLGNSDRGALIGPGFDNWDLTIGKNFPLRESLNLQFRAELYNAFNHTQFDGVNTTLGNPAMGFVTSTRPPRQMQLALRLEF